MNYQIRPLQKCDSRPPKNISSVKRCKVREELTMKRLQNKMPLFLSPTIKLRGKKVNLIKVV